MESHNKVFRTYGVFCCEGLILNVLFDIIKSNKKNIVLM
jgi:hypothetical protein